MSSEHRIPVGYFDASGQTEPVYDPGLDVACPVCGNPLDTEAIQTHSLMWRGGERSLFFRAHKRCWPSTRERDEVERGESTTNKETPMNPTTKQEAQAMLDAKAEQFARLATLDAVHRDPVQLAILGNEMAYLRGFIASCEVIENGPFAEAPQ